MAPGTRWHAEEACWSAEEQAACHRRRTGPHPPDTRGLKPGGLSGQLNSGCWALGAAHRARLAPVRAGEIPLRAGGVLPSARQVGAKVKGVSSAESDL